MANDVDPIADDELLYRRIPMVWCASGHIDPEAFAPRKDDTTGLSVVRAKYTSIADAAKGRPGKSYRIAVLRAGDLRARGIDIEPRPETADGFDPSHAELPAITYEHRKNDEVITMQQLLAGELCRSSEGPFETLSDTEVVP